MLNCTWSLPLILNQRKALVAGEEGEVATEVEEGDMEEGDMGEEEEEEEEGGEGMEDGEVGGGEEGEGEGCSQISRCRMEIGHARIQSELMMYI